jgi:hypothetical protein
MSDHRNAEQTNASTTETTPDTKKSYTRPQLTNLGSLQTETQTILGGIGSGTC